MEALDKDGTRTDSRASETSFQVEMSRNLTLLLLRELLYKVYVNIAHVFRVHFPWPLSKYSSIMPQLSIWSSRVVFWVIATHILCTLVLVVAGKGPIFCFGKSVDINFLRLALVVPLIVTLLIPGGWGHDWKALVIWTFSLAPCVLIGLATRAMRIILLPVYFIPWGSNLITTYLLGLIM